MKSPFKFLDSYTKEDRAIFFGREREIEELYHRIFESKTMLVYGVSGTGKSSLIHCGLANKFSETDWLPLVIRRGSNILKSMAASIKSAAITHQPGEVVTPAQFRKVTRSLYLDHYKPIFFIFDQFEELFIFGSKEEKKAAALVFKTLVESDIQCRLIFVMREEYMAGITEFEKYIPTIFQNRVRIEKMSHINAIEAIEGPCKVAGITIEEGFAEALLEKLSPECGDVELTYLQVYLDKISGMSLEEKRADSGSISFTLSMLDKTGNVSDLLGSFLEEQLKELDEPDTGLAILKSFVSLKGTKKHISETEVIETTRTFGKEIPPEITSDYLQKFVNIRILKDKDDNGKYELRHDSLASKIYEKITLVEKELLEINQFLENAWDVYTKRDILLNDNDLKYIYPYRDRLFVNKKLKSLIEYSEKQLNKAKKSIKRLAIAGIFALVAFSTGSIFHVYKLPFAYLLFFLGISVYVIGFLPLFGYYVIKTKENRTMNILFLIFSLIFATNIYLYSVGTRKNLWKAFTTPIFQNDTRIKSMRNRFNNRTDSIYLAIERSVKTHPSVNNPIRETALKIKERTSEIINYIQDLKIELILNAEGDKSKAINGKSVDVTKIAKLDEYNVPTQIMLGSDYNGKAFLLKNLIIDYINTCNGFIDNDRIIVNSIDSTLNLGIHKSIVTKSKKNIESKIVQWEEYYFFEIGLGNVIVTLSQLQADLKYCESEYITYLYNRLKR
jgi:hypothetical protein